MWKEIPLVFHKDATYDDCFITNELTEEFDGQFERFGKTEKIITFSVLIKKELNNGKTIT